MNTAKSNPKPLSPDEAAGEYSKKRYLERLSRDGNTTVSLTRIDKEAFLAGDKNGYERGLQEGRRQIYQELMEKSEAYGEELNRQFKKAGENE